MKKNELKINFDYLFICLIMTLLSLMYITFKDFPIWGDENHFIQTIYDFKKLNIKTLMHYDEMSTPLPFILYSLWGKIFGFNIEILRLFSIMIAFCSYTLLYILLLDIFSNTRISSITTLFVFFNPYMLGLSIFIFTDMLAIFSVICSCVAIRKEKSILLFISICFGLLCRQFLIFFYIAVTIYYILKYWKENNNSSMLFASLVSIIPLLFLFYIWGGITPDNQRSLIFMEQKVQFKPSFLSLYISQIFIYLFPILILIWKKIYMNKKVIIFSLLISIFYVFFPIKPNKHYPGEIISTVGLFHKTLDNIFDNFIIIDFLFYLCFLLALPVLIFIIKNSYDRILFSNITFELFLNLSILLFLFFMPFSYICWEKYFLPILPVISIRLLLLIYEEKISDTTK